MLTLSYLLQATVQVLVFHMSVKFALPAEDTIQKFLLSVRKQALKDYMRRSSNNSESSITRDRKRAKHYYDAAVADANRLIVIWSALADHKSSVVDDIRVESDEEDTAMDELLSLSPEEKEILTDSSIDSRPSRSQQMNDIRTQVINSSQRNYSEVITEEEARPVYE